MKFSVKVDNGPMNRWLNFGNDPDHHLDTRIIFRIRHYREIYGKWLTDINLLLILIRQMTALVRRALADVCTVPVLLVYLFYYLHEGGYVFVVVCLFVCLSL